MTRFAFVPPRLAAVGVSALAGLAAAPGSARAALISATYAVPSLAVDPATTSISRTMSVDANQFNPALGTLTSIEVTWSATGTMSATLTGDGGFSWGGGGTTSLNGAGYGSFGINASNSGTAGQSITATNAGGNDVTLVGGVNTAPATVASAVGTGTVPIAWGFNGNGGGANLSNWQFTSSGSVTVAYNYAPAVPEPAGAGLLAVGAVALLRRKRAR